MMWQTVTYEIISHIKTVSDLGNLRALHFISENENQKLLVDLARPLRRNSLAQNVDGPVVHLHVHE